MKHIFLVTGNANKLTEWHRILPDNIEIETLDLDLPEIQSIDPKEIVADKAKRAYDIAKKPVVVEDVSASIEKLNGLPGPFVKFFIKALGHDALYQLAGEEGARATVSCAVAYYDGEELVALQSNIPGKVVAPRGANGFGFDATFVPDGHGKTYAEMDEKEKDGVSHRSRAIQLLVEHLEELP